MEVPNPNPNHNPLTRVSDHDVSVTQSLAQCLHTDLGTDPAASSVGSGQCHQHPSRIQSVVGQILESSQSERGQSNWPNIWRKSAPYTWTPVQLQSLSEDEGPS